jgi:uncharacterized membrane protein
VIFQDISIKLGSNSIKIVDHLSSDIDKDILRRISDKSGIKSLLISKEDEDAVTLVKSLITKSIKDNLSKCQLIIIVSESKTQRIPPISSLILTDVKTEDTLVLDLDSGCAGYVQALQIVDNLFKRIPILRTIYSAIVQLTDSFRNQEGSKKSVVLVEYPRKGSWAVGFATKENKGELKDKTNKELINVFVPTTPNPTSGFLLMFPKEDVIYLDMSFEEASKFIVSAGTSNPKS